MQGLIYTKREREQRTPNVRWWTPRELEILRQKYGRVRASRLAKELNRSRFAVISAARRSGLHEPKAR